MRPERQSGRSPLTCLHRVACIVLAALWLAACSVSTQDQPDEAVPADAGHTDATPRDVGAADAGSDGLMDACGGPQGASGLIDKYCRGGLAGDGGAPCVSDVAVCIDRGEQERRIAEQARCVCYLCQLYAYVVQNRVCISRDLGPAFLLEQCLGGALRCP